MPLESWVQSIVMVAVTLIGFYFLICRSAKKGAKAVMSMKEIKEAQKAFKDLRAKFDEVIPFLAWLGDPKTHAKIKRIVENIDSFLKKLNR